MSTIVLVIILILVGAVILAPFGLMIVGMVMRFSQKEVTKEKGKKLLLWGAIVLAAEVLIGFAVCSSMNFSIH